ncbi:MAG: carboxypeptidase regulatory-like domain-containing protein [Bacteroidetes bacterium]|nr:carboxypeptidase regulatory-like domain-containing protein [Bacteroidota bacterium]
MKNVTKMVMMLLVLAMAFMIAPQARSQTVLLTESWENGGAIPANWATAQVTGTTLGITYVLGGSAGYPVVAAAYNGSYFVKYNSFSISGSGTSSTRLYRTAGTSTVGYAGASVDFAFYHDPGYTGNPDNVQVQFSTNGGSTWTTAGTQVNRYDGSTGWKIHTIMLPAAAGNQANLRIGFLFTSYYGNDCYLDFAHLNGIALGTLAGTVTSASGGAPIANASVVVNALPPVLTNAAGFYSIPNLNAGTVNVTVTATGFVPYNGTAAIVGGVTTTLNVAMLLPPKAGGVVTDASTGNFLVGATIKIGNPPNQTTWYSTAGGVYLTGLLPVVGTQPIVIGKTGFDDLVSTITLTAGTTASLDAALLPTAVPPGPFTAALNNPTTPTAVNLNWGVPQGLYQMIYDDGTQDNFAIWATANNLNALKFTPLGWPVKLIGGKVNLGTVANYPTTTVFPLTKFMMMAYKADGAGGLPGTKIDSVEVTANAFGWVDFSFAAPITINSGDFYLVMKQGGIPPQAAGLGVDLTNTQLRSYAKFVTGGAPWIPAAGNFMMRAILQGVGGPILADNSSSNKEIITAGAVNGLIYQTPVTTVTGYEGVARTEPIEWSTMQNNNVAQQFTYTAATNQELTDNGVGSTSDLGTVNPTDAPASVLFDNGPMITGVGTGFGGADESMLQAPLTGYGSNVNHAAYYRIADDFSVTGTAWNVTSLEFYGYQTGSTTTSSFTAAYCRILNGIPGQPGTTVVWGDTTTNRLSSSSFTNIYRVNVTGNNQRPIMKLVVNTTGLTLPAGNYWVEFNASGTIASGPWCPYVTINNTPTTGNGLLYTGTVGGYTPINATYNQGVPFKINGTQPTNSTMSYQVWRLKQGEEGTPAAWTSIWTGNVNTTVDNGWPTLPCAAYRWAVKAIYSPPGQRPSAATFSNVIGKCWIANVNVCATLTCAANPKAGTVVKLVNTNYPDTNYTKTTDTSGCVHFTNVWKGNYTLTVIRFTYPVYTQNIVINGDASYNVMLLQDAAPATNLVVNDQSLHATWSPPRAMVYQLDENFSTGFATNAWVISGGTNWQMSAGTGNPAPSAFFNWTPTVSNYDQYLTSKSLAGVHAPQMKFKYDIFLDNYGTTNLNTMAVELWNGTTWTVLKTYDNSSGVNIPWTSESLDITSQTHNPAFKVRFHAAGVSSVDIDGWYIDNVKIVSTDGTTGPNPCVIGYNFYLNNTLSAFTPDTTYNIPPNQVVYGQTYQACVKAVYGSGYSPQICVTFTSHFLYPARDLTATGIECNAYLTWKKPVTMTDAPEILGMTQRTEFPNTNAEFSPYIFTMKNTTNADNSDALWDVLYGWAGSGAGQAGVEIVGDFIYSTSWSAGPPWFFKYQATTGALIESFSIPGVTAIRDLAYDGTQFMYGGSNAASIYKMDFVAKTLVATIPTSVPAVRHIAYDPTNNGLWCGGWTDMYLVNITTGATIATGPAVVSIYGSAWENQTTGGPYLWLHGQGAAGTGDEYQKWKITGTTLTNTGIVHDNASTNINGPAGGLGCGQVGTKLGLIGLNQGTSVVWIWATEIGDWSGGTGGGSTPVGLVGYNIYRDGAFIHRNPHQDSITYYDYGRDPGTYKYEVKARYDLTSYGFPGQFGESLGNTAGEKTVTLNCGAPLPFYEPWDLGTYLFQNWSPVGHWTMNTGIGNPAPCADFTWQPAIANYSQELKSEVIDASAWTCAKIWLDFDLKLIDRNNTGKEKLTIDIQYGGSWHQKLEVTNNGSTNWVSKHIDISAVKGKAFRIRFVANGVNSADILHWYVDNIHAYGICTPATALHAAQSHYTTTLTWTAPNCVSTVPTVLKKLFQWSGTPDNGYFQAYNNAYGVVYDLATYPDASLNKINFHHASWGTTGIWQYKIHVVDWTTFTELATLGPLTTTGDDKWENNVLLGNIAGVGGKLIGIMLEPLSNSATDAYPCFSADNIGPDGVSVHGVLPTYSGFVASTIGDFLQDLYIEIPAGDKMDLVQPRKVYVNELQTLANTRVATGVNNHPAYLSTNQVSINDNGSVADSSVLLGYNVYRTSGTGIAPYAILNGATPVTQTTYVDTYPASTPDGSTFRYFVTVLYKNSANSDIICEPATDTIMVPFFAVGLNDLANRQIMIYPNPATEIVNIKSDYTITSVDVMNFVGQTVYTSSNVDAKTAKINVSAIKTGVYFVKVATNGGTRTVKITVTH